LALLAVAVSVMLACGAALAATVNGDAASNTITGTDATDVLYGYGGDDNISGGSSADRMFGGEGNDQLFGTDKYQSGVTDRETDSVDGSDRLEGELGDDMVVGASGADTLRGGPGADTLIEGPANDAAQDTVEADPTSFTNGPPPESANWNDNINVASSPARKDYVNCGPGTDEVEADALDVINANCETVNVIDPTIVTTAQPSSDEAAHANSDTPPAYPVSSTETFAEEPAGADPAANDDGATAPTGGEASAALIRGFNCWAAPRYRGATYCSRAYLSRREGWGLGVNSTQGRWIYYRAEYPWIRDVDGYLNGATWDDYDVIDEYSSTAIDAYIYMRTSCYSKCWKWTWVDGYKHYW